MDRKTLETKKISDLRVIAETVGIENASDYKKAELINLLMVVRSQYPILLRLETLYFYHRFIQNCLFQWLEIGITQFRKKRSRYRESSGKH
jgi:hypothetical protein